MTDPLQGLTEIMDDFVMEMLEGLIQCLEEAKVSEEQATVVVMKFIEFLDSDD